MSLSEHGFMDVTLAEDYHNICEVVPQAREIARLGQPQTIQGQPWRFLQRSLAEPGTHVGWYLAELFREGTYGKIYRAYRMIVQRRADGLFDVTSSPTEVVVKQTEPPTGASQLPAEDVQAHVSEALLHVLAWQTLQKTVVPRGVPRPYEVFGDGDGAGAWKSMSLCMSYVRGRTLYSFFGKHWQPETKTANARLLAEILAQLAYILFHLQHQLQLNHRDVKVNNILVSRHPRDPKLLVLPGGAASVKTDYELVLIDFGFACVGCPPPRVPNTVFQAGSWFPLGELCCKSGRDIAQLLFCIHCYFPLDAFLPTDIVTEIRRWLTVTIGTVTIDMLHGFTKEGRPRRAGASGHPEFHTGIYEFLRRGDVDPAACAPTAVFNFCSNYLSASAI